MIHKKKKTLKVSNKTFSKRLFFIFTIQFLCFIILFIRLFYLQIIKYTKYKTLSDKNRVRSAFILPVRGKILDNNQQELARNLIKYRVLGKKSKKDQFQKTLSNIALLLNLKVKDLHYNTKKSYVIENNGFVLIQDNLEWNQLSKLLKNKHIIPDIIIETSYTRYYPYSKIMSHILGYVTSSQQRDSINGKSFYDQRYKKGQDGIEKLYNYKLKGKIGIKYIEVNALGSTVKELGDDPDNPVIAGDDIQLSINSSLQQYIYNLLDMHRGSVVVQKIQTGEVLSMVSKPSYNSNIFIEGLSQKQWHNIRQDPNQPLINRAISSHYPPGSIFKIIMMLTALKQGFDPLTEFDCNGALNYGNQTFKCWNHKGHGSINIHQAIQQSCNVYFYNLALLYKIKDIYKMSMLLGLGQKTLIDLPHEIPGLIPNRSWKKKHFKENWYTGDTINASIGQGSTRVTTLQLANMMSRIISGGYEVKPIIIKPNQPSSFKKLKLDSEHITRVKNALFSVVNEPGGSAIRSRTNLDDFPLSGKTGTAQVVGSSHLKSLDLNDTDIIPYKYRTHSLFCGFAPFDKPLYSIAIIIEHGGSGSGVAAPIAKQISQYLYKNLYLKNYS